MDKLRCETCGYPLVVLAVTTTEVRADFIAEVEHTENTFALEFSKEPISVLDWHIVCVNPDRSHRQHRLEVNMQIEELADLAYLPSLSSHMPNRWQPRTVEFSRPSDEPPDWQDFSSRGQIVHKQQSPDIPLPELRRKPR